MDIAAVRAALATAAAAVTADPALTCFGYRPDSVPEPCLYVAGYTIDYDRAADRGADQITFRLRLLVSRTDDLTGQAALDGFMAGSGAGSVKAALEADGTLGGRCDWLHVSGAAADDLIEHGGTWYFGADITVEVNGDGA